MSDEQLKDANTDAESSTESNADANKESASSAVQNSGADKSESADTLQSVVERAASQAVAQEEKEEESGPKVEPDKEEKEGEGADEKDGEGTEEAEEEKEVEGEKKEGETELPPFHDHPRWKEMVAERDSLREQAKAAESYKTLAEQQKGIVEYCQGNGISPQQFQDALELVALINNSPGAALKKLQPIVEQLGQFDEGRLPEDLEAKVADGKLELEDAQEIARLRAQSRNGEYTGRMAQYRNQQVADAANMDALSRWEQSVIARDPDFRPKAKPTDVDGKYELVTGLFKGMIATQQPRSPQEVVAAVQRAYDSVDKTFKTRLTPTVSKKVLPSTSPSPRRHKEPQSLEEAVNVALARHGL